MKHKRLSLFLLPFLLSGCFLSMTSPSKSDKAASSIRTSSTKKQGSASKSSSNYRTSSSYFRMRSVEFYLFEDRIYDSFFVPVGGRVGRPEDPFVPGYEFFGWFADERHTEPFDFNEGIYQDVRIYADLRPSDFEYYVLGDLKAPGIQRDRVLNDMPAYLMDEITDSSYFARLNFIHLLEDEEIYVVGIGSLTGKIYDLGEISGVLWRGYYAVNLGENDVTMELDHYDRVNIDLLEGGPHGAFRGAMSYERTDDDHNSYYLIENFQVHEGDIIYPSMSYESIPDSAFSVLCDLLGLDNIGNYVHFVPLEDNNYGEYFALEFLTDAVYNIEFRIVDNASPDSNTAFIFTRLG
ncbi:MAG: InlB B-repeat-containing protein [Bacilli bacterium]|nr:InlB B-repeat-containing protein [Bacilli bacterium]